MKQKSRRPRATPKGKTRSRGNRPRGPVHRLRRWTESHGLCARDSLIRLFGNPLSSFMTITVIAIALLLPGLAQLFSTNLAAAGAALPSQGQITLYLDDSLSEAEAMEVSERLLSRDGINSVRFISRADARDEFASYSGLGPVLDELDENPLPASIVVTPSTSARDATQRLFQELQTLPAVVHAQLDLVWLQRLDALRDLLGRISWVLAIILGIGVLFITGNTIRLAIENRRMEIQVVKLVGGSDSFAARPFLYTGLWLGLAGGILASLLTALVVLSFRGPLENLLGLYETRYELQGLGMASTLRIMLQGAVLGWLGAALSTAQQLRALRDF